jgi:elongation factor 3
MVPLLVRALNNRSSSLLRPTVVIADNLFRLVKNPADAGQFMPQILPGLDVIIDTAGPEIRSLATAAKNTLVKSAAGAKNVLKVSSQDSLKIIKRLTSDRKLFLGTFYDESFLLVAQIISLLVTEEIYQKSMWKEAIAPMIQPILHDDCEPILDSLFAHFYNVYKVIQFDIEVATSRRAR